MIKDIITGLIAQYSRKNTAYGGSAHQTFLNFGSASYSIRIHDKLQRFEQLIGNPDIPQGDEAIEDTLGDAVTYAAMFAADLTLSMFKKENTHFDETVEILYLLGSCTEKEIEEMASKFSADIIKGRSLTKTIVAMHNANETPASYVMLAAYLLDLLNERMKKNAPCN